MIATEKPDEQVYFSALLVTLTFKSIELRLAFRKALPMVVRWYGFSV